MSNKSLIAWTDATWNPTTGCTKISDGCVNCYAERLSLRLYKMGVEKYKNKFKLTLHEDALNIPLKWRNPKKIFVNSMSDLFHKDVPFNFIDRIFNVMKQANWHQFQILTKRPERMLEFTKKYYKKPVSNVLLGTTVENSKYKKRIDILRKVPAKTRFLSIEPLLGPMGKLNLKGINWVIVGGESGKNHRPMKPEWIREIRNQCIEKNTPFFFKQWGGSTFKSGGRILDGKYWNQYPEITNTIIPPKPFLYRSSLISRI
jgi:protein gp37